MSDSFTDEVEQLAATATELPRLLTEAVQGVAVYKHALGIKSPSTVMAQVGDFTALGLAHGIQRSSKHARIAAQGMAMSVQQGATLTGGPSWAGVPMGGGRGTVVNNYTVNVRVDGHVLTERKLVDVVEQGFLRRGGRNPVTYPGYKR